MKNKITIEFMQKCINCGNTQLTHLNTLAGIHTASELLELSRDRCHKDCPKCRKENEKQNSENRQYQQEFFRFN